MYETGAQSLPMRRVLLQWHNVCKTMCSNGSRGDFPDCRNYTKPLPSVFRLYMWCTTPRQLQRRWHRMEWRELSTVLWQVPVCGRLIIWSNCESLQRTRKHSNNDFSIAIQSDWKPDSIILGSRFDMDNTGLLYTWIKQSRVFWQKYFWTQENTPR